jgi:hypothetical protein
MMGVVDFDHQRGRLNAGADRVPVPLRQGMPHQKAARALDLDSELL